jgi:hypothetical protein
MLPWNAGWSVPGATTRVLIVASLLAAGAGAGGGGGGGGGAGAGPLLRNSITYVMLAFPSADVTVMAVLTFEVLFITKAPW